jgi:Zn-dependent oligopeptidase
MLTKDDFYEMYENNTFIDYYVNNSIKENIANADLYTGFIDYLDRDLKLLKNKSGWDDFFVPFAKIIKLLFFINEYIESYEQLIVGQSPEEKNWFRLGPYALNLVEKHLETFDTNGNNEYLNILTKLVSSRSISIEQKKIVKAYRDLFFEGGKASSKEAVRLENLLSKHLKKFEKNLNALWNRDTAVFVPEDKKFKVSGIDKEFLSVAWQNAKKRDLSGWLFYTADFQTESLLKTAKNRVFRKSIYEAFKKLNTDERANHSNEKNLRNILLIKNKQAKELKGKNSYAELVSSNYVLNTPKKIYQYLDGVEREIQPMVDNIFKKIHNLAEADNIKNFKPWDIYYYFNKMKDQEINKTKTNFSDYYHFDSFVDKLFSFIKKEFSIDFQFLSEEKISGSSVYKYAIEDPISKKRGYLILAPFENTLNPQEKRIAGNDYLSGKEDFPAVEFIRFDFNKNKVLRFYDVRVLLHEFGHFLHSFYMKNNDYFLQNSLISWDLVEVPSIFFENMAYDFDFMQKMSSHHITGNKISKKMLKDEIQNDLYEMTFDLSCNLKKYNAQMWLHDVFNEKIKETPSKLLNEKIGDDSIIFNITASNSMLDDNHLADYSSSGYVYFYSENVANQLLKKYKDSFKYVYTKIFNSNKDEDLKILLNKSVDLNRVDLEAFLTKGVKKIKVAGI